MNKIAIYFVALISIPYIAIAGGYDSLKIIKIIDGDTLLAQDAFSQKILEIQLLGIDAPEIVSNEQFSKEAKEYLENLILNKTVKARYCYVTSNQFFYEIYLDEKLTLSNTVNYLLVKDGFAKVHIDKPLKCFINESTYVSAEKEAKTKNKGIWSASFK